MKKSLVKIAAAMSAAAILTLAGCSNPETPGYNFSSDSKTDTVLNLASPEVKVTAYPGMNYVSWSPVANAKSYVLYIYEEGSHVKTVSCDYNKELSYADTEIKNGKNYKYIVEAESKNSSGREVVMENTLSSPVTVKAIVPAYETSPLALCDFESGKNAEYVVSASNINAYKDDDGTIAVSFPAKAYLNYNVYYSRDNEYETHNTNRTEVEKALSNKASNNSTLHASATITSAGTYHFIVDAKAENSRYGKTDTVVSDKTVEVELLAGSGAQITSAVYRDDDTIRVEFSGFNFSLDGSVAPAEYYKVYRSVNYEPDVAPNDTQNFKKPTLYTPVSGTVKATDISSKKFFVEDEIEDNKVAYTYTLVVTDGERFADLVDSSMRKIVKAKVVESTFGTSSIQPTPKCLDNDDYYNDIEWTITLPVAGITINDVYYLEKDSAEGHTVVAADFVKDNEHKVAFTTAGYTTGRNYKAFTKNHTPGTDVYLLVSISMEGYEDAEVVSSRAAVVYEHNISEATFRVTKYDNTVDGATKADYERKDNDVVLEIKHTLYEEQLDDYTYTVYEARPIIKTTMTSETIVWDFDTVDWTIGEVNEKFQAAGFKKNAYENTAASEYVSFVELENLTPGDYAWKLVVANKDTGKVENTIVRHIQISGVESKFIEFVPKKIDAVRVAQKQPLSDISITFTKTGHVKFIKGTEGALDGYVTGIIEEAAENGVTYSLYRTNLVTKTNLTKVVWTKVGTFGAPQKEFAEEPVYKLDSNGQRDSELESYAVSLKYSFTDSSLSTGDGYSYVVVCEKEGCEPDHSDPADVPSNN